MPPIRRPPPLPPPRPPRAPPLPRDMLACHEQGRCYRKELRVEMEVPMSIFIVGLRLWEIERERGESLG